MTEKRASLTTRELPTPISSENSPPAADPTPARHTVHCVLMNKGGIGKTIVSMNLVQFLRDRGTEVYAVDLDPMNHSLAEFSGLRVRKVEMFDRDHIHIRGADIDGLAQSMLTDDASFVIDNGAAGFVRFGDYLVDNEMADLLASRDRRLLIHAVIGGGDMTEQCILGLHSLISAFPASVSFVVWLNEHSGPVEIAGMGFEEMTIYRDNILRIAGLVRLRRLSDLFLRDFNEMLRRRMTYAEAIDHPDFHIMNRQRLVMTRRDVWQQLEAVL